MAKLLLLDDDEHALEWMRVALETRGHEVSTFTSASAALAAIKKSPPDLIVSDILMPEMDGLAFARVARSHRGIPLIFVSIARKEAQAVLVGATGFVRKPATAGEVRAAVERVLGEKTRVSTILVVDDDADVCELYRDILEQERLCVVTAKNGVEALAVMRARHIDLAIIDVHMPVMNGAELVREMRRDPALERLPVLVQTNDPSALDAPQWAMLRVAQVLDKTRFVDWLFGTQHRVAS
jgi:CheY-like chemotaxis protein